MEDWIELQQSILRVAGVAVTVAVLVGIFALPGAAVSPTFQVAVSPNAIKHGQTTTIRVGVANGVPNCVYTVRITVTGPTGSGVSGSKTVTFPASSAGNGATTTPYPGSFLPTANTNTVGTYNVAAMFRCGTAPYSAPAATATFKVTK